MLTPRMARLRRAQRLLELAAKAAERAAADLRRDGHPDLGTPLQNLDGVLLQLGVVGLDVAEFAAGLELAEAVARPRA